MSEFMSFAAGMVVLMVLIAVLPYVFEIPDAIAKYFRRRSRQIETGLPARDPDDLAARLLGRSLRRAQLSSEATARVMTAFWAADVCNRRALAHLVAGMADKGPIDDDDLLVVLHGLATRPESSVQGPPAPSASTGISELPGCAK